MMLGEQFDLWSTYGEVELTEVELTAAIPEAERACDNAAAISVSAVNRDGYELRLTLVEKLVKEATKSAAGTSSKGLKSS